MCSRTAAWWLHGDPGPATVLKVGREVHGGPFDRAVVQWGRFLAHGAGLIGSGRPWVPSTAVTALQRIPVDALVAAGAVAHQSMCPARSRWWRKSARPAPSAN